MEIFFNSLLLGIDINNGDIKPVFNDVDKISTASWSPDSSKIAFIYENNLYYKSLQHDEIVQITLMVQPEIFNGKPDWVYEEEVYGSDHVFWWSPESDKVAFLRSNNTQVPEFIIPFYAQSDHQDYPEIVKIKYPKAGYPNPIVDVLTYDLNTKNLHNHHLKSEKSI